MSPKNKKNKKKRSRRYTCELCDGIDNSLMIQCDRCELRYHLKCLNVKSIHEDDDWVCLECNEKEKSKSNAPKANTNESRSKSKPNAQETQTKASGSQSKSKAELTEDRTKEDEAKVRNVEAASQSRSNRTKSRSSGSHWAAIELQLIEEERALKAKRDQEYLDSKYKILRENYERSERSKSDKQSTDRASYTHRWVQQQENLSKSADASKVPMIFKRKSGQGPVEEQAQNFMETIDDIGFDKTSPPDRHVQPSAVNHIPSTIMNQDRSKSAQMNNENQEYAESSKGKQDTNGEPIPRPDYGTNTIRDKTSKSDIVWGPNSNSTFAASRNPRTNQVQSSSMVHLTDNRLDPEERERFAKRLVDTTTSNDEHTRSKNEDTVHQESLEWDNFLETQNDMENPHQNLLMNRLKSYREEIDKKNPNSGTMEKQQFRNRNSNLKDVIHVDDDEDVTGAHSLINSRKHSNSQSDRKVDFKDIKVSPKSQLSFPNPTNDDDPDAEHREPRENQRIRLNGPREGSTISEQVNTHQLEICPDHNESDNEMQQRVKEFFSVENFGVHANSKLSQNSKDEERALEMLNELTRKVSGRYETGLLWRDENIQLPDSYPMAVKRLISLEKHGQKMIQIMAAKITDYVSKGYARKLTPEDLQYEGRVWYFPLFGVTHPKKPGKIRMVFDAAAKVKSVSLNSQLLKEPDLYTSLIDILRRFRERLITGGTSIRNAQRFNIDKRVMWTDSATVVSWLNSENRKYSQFVAHRVGEILENSDVNEWRWIPTEENVADEATKWKKIPNFDPNNRWFRGPDFLRLLLAEYHSKFFHQNHETVVNEVRQKFYIPRLREALRGIRKKCQSCKIKRAHPLPPQMADLPQSRLATRFAPFSFVGIDFFGPMYVTIGRRREKRWGVLFTCLTIRAIHIEIANGLDTNSCILCIGNFVADHGPVNEFHSDWGTNFKGSDNELQAEIKKIDRQKLQTQFTSTYTKWIFNPPASPHMGGSWERLIRSVKSSIAEILPTRTPKEDMLRNLLKQVQNVINSRPLTFIPLDVESDEALTPNHFLKLSSNGLRPPCEIELDGTYLRRSWKESQRLTELFWKRFIREYLPSITRRTKWHKRVPQLKEGDLVLVVDENNPRNTYPKARIVRTTTGSNNQVRRAEIELIAGTKSNSTGQIYEVKKIKLWRPAHKLALLDVATNGGLAQPELDRKTGSGVGATAFESNVSAQSNLQEIDTTGRENRA